MTVNKIIFFIGIIFILLVSACKPAEPVAPSTATPLLSTATTSPTETQIPQPTKTQVPSPFPIPDYSTEITISADQSKLAFSNPSPVPQIATFYKNQLLAYGCALVYESGSAMEAIVFTFENCELGDEIKILIYPYQGGTAASITNKAE